MCLWLCILNRGYEVVPRSAAQCSKVVFGDLPFNTKSVPFRDVRFVFLLVTNRPRSGDDGNSLLEIPLCWRICKPIDAADVAEDKDPDCGAVPAVCLIEEEWSVCPWAGSPWMWARVVLAKGELQQPCRHVLGHCYYTGRWQNMVPNSYQ